MCGISVGETALIFRFFALLCKRMKIGAYNIGMVKSIGFYWLEIMSREKLIFAEISFNFHNMNTNNVFAVTAL